MSEGERAKAAQREAPPKHAPTSLGPRPLLCVRFDGTPIIAKTGVSTAGALIPARRDERNVDMREAEREGERDGSVPWNLT